MDMLKFEVAVKYTSGDVRHTVIHKNQKLGRKYRLEILIKVCRHTGDSQHYRTWGDPQESQCGQRRRPQTELGAFWYQEKWEAEK